jgi:hypothetical protein
MAVAATLALSGCSIRGDESRPFSARFSSRTDWNLEGRRWRDTTRGAFDWDARRGWATERSPGLEVVRTIQVGDLCFERRGKRRWRRTRASDPEGTCSYDLFQSPKSSFENFRKVARHRVVGKKEIGGVPTTHYRGFIHVGAVEGSVELWVDEEGVVRRERFEDTAKAFVLTRDYYDFGADVKVAVPN